MTETLHHEPAAEVLLAAVDGARTAVQHVIKLVEDGSLTDLGAVGLVGFLQEWETVRNMMPVVDRTAIQYGTEQGVPAALTQRTMAQVLAEGLRLSSFEARRRVKAAEHLAERRTMLGEPLPPVRPHLAAAQREGLITPEQVAIIDNGLRDVDRDFDPAEVEAGEEILAQVATQLGPAELKVAVQKTVEAIDPDGAEPDEKAQERKRFLRMCEQGDGSWAGEFRLTADLGRKLKDLLDPLTKPKTTAHDVDRGDGKQRGKFVEDDDRTIGQRRHDALGDILDRLLRRGDNPDSGGTPATLLIHIDWDDLLARAGIARLADGTLVSVEKALELADQAEIHWVFTDSVGAVLDLRHMRRIASKDQTIALYARDKGCSFPGCDVEPSWCERHHVISWLDGGLTNLGNLTLVCSFHHHQFEKRGWQCVMQDGLPYWIPPKWIDHHQTPRLNHRIAISNWHPQDQLDL